MAKPRITVSNLIIDSSVTVKAELKMKGVKIYFTTDDSEPNETSKLYEQFLEIKTPGIYKFKAFHSAWKTSETEAVEFIKKGKPVDTIIWETEPNQKYRGQGLNTLVNNTKARINYMDSQWVGFDTIARATTMFKDITEIKSIDIGYLNNPAAWIFPPEKISVFISYDGINFHRKRKISYKPFKTKPQTKGLKQNIYL